MSTETTFSPLMTGRRPEGFPFPNIWCRFNGLKPLNDGKVPKFWIEDLTSETSDFVLNHVLECFLKEAVMSKSTKLYKDLKAVEIVRSIWREIIGCHMSLMAVTINPEGRRECVGCNILMPLKVNVNSWEHLQESEGPVGDILEAVNFIENKVDLKEKYSVDEYLGALGLWVHPTYRGQGIGLELLRTRKPLCQTLGLNLTVTLFTGTAAQKCAQRAGFELLVEESYENYRNSKGLPVFKEAEGKSFMYMAMKFD